VKIREEDWYLVREAMRRGKQGKMQPGDQELCNEAFTSDPKRYKKESAEVRAAVHNELMELFRRRK
jgi:hypothetical protein